MYTPSKHFILSLLYSLCVFACNDSGTEATLAQSGEEQSQSEELTWSTDVRPIIAERCGACHFEGGAAPFALDRYETLKMYGELALNSMESGRMPPWQAATGCNPIENERSMPLDELEIFKSWWSGSRLKGPETSESEVNEPTRSDIFEPTHRAGLSSAYTPKVGQSDDYRCFLLDLEIDQTMYLTGSDVLPGNGLVHHVLVYALTGEQAEEALRLDESEEGPGYTCFGTPIPFAVDRENQLMNIGSMLSSLSFPSQIGSWVPGSSPNTFDLGTALRIEAGSKVVMQVHYSAVAGELIADENTEYLARLTTEQPETLIKTRPFAQQQLEIPAEASNVVTSQTLPYYNDAPSKIVGMAGHMHLLGKSIKAELERETGELQCALNIPEWDFSWQESYTFKSGHEVLIESGDRLKLTCTYDNSKLNQPVVNGVQQEPRDVTWGEGTLDEMCLLYTQVSEPFTEVTSSESVCSSSCTEECGIDLACLTRCEEDKLQCVGCMIDTAMSCEGARQCLGGLLTARECLTTCTLSSIMLGGNFGACMEAECSESWTMSSSCLSEKLRHDDCRSELSVCGF